MSLIYVSSKYICDGVTLLKTADGDKHVAVDISLAEKLSVAGLAYIESHYLIFDEESACLALFEIADYDNSIITSPCISWLALNNAICKYHPAYPEEHNISTVNDAEEFLKYNNGKIVMNYPNYGFNYLEI